MSRVHGCILIARPVEEVFAVVVDQRNEVHYNPAMTSSVLETEGPIGVGSTFRATVLTRGRPLPVVIQYTEVDPPRRLASRSVTAGTVVEGAVRCDPHEASTLFSWDWQVRRPGLLRLAGPLVALVGNRQERRIWTGLKRYLEDGQR